MYSDENQCVAVFTTPTPQISCLALHNNLLYAGSINQINVYDSSNNFLHVDTMTTHDVTSGSVKSIAFTATKILTAHQDSKIRVWEITPSKQQHHHRLLSTLPTVKDRFLRLMSPGNYVHVRRHHKRLWIEHWDTVSGLVVNGSLVYSVSWDKSFKIWNADSDFKCLLSVKAHDDAVNAISVCENGVIYTGSADGIIRVWEKQKKKKYMLMESLKRHKSTVNALALNEKGLVLFSGSSDRWIMVWKRDGCRGTRIVLVEALWGHQGAVLCLNNVGDFLVSGSSDRTVRIWRRDDVRESYRCVMVMKGHESPVKSLVLVSGTGSVFVIVKI